MTDTSETLMKTCSKCKTEKPLNEFYSDRGKKDGLSSYCKPCSRKSSRKWALNNPEKARERDRKWARENPDKVREYRRRWYEENREAALEQMRQYREENREARLEYSRKWYEENREYALERNRQWKLDNRPHPPSESTLERVRRCEAIVKRFPDRAKDLAQIILVWADRPDAPQWAAFTWHTEGDEFLADCLED